MCFHLVQGRVLFLDLSFLPVFLLAHGSTNTTAFLWGSLMWPQIFTFFLFKESGTSFCFKKKMVYCVIWSLLTPGALQNQFSRSWRKDAIKYLWFISFWMIWIGLELDPGIMLCNGSRATFVTCNRVFEMHLLIWVQWKLLNSKQILLCANENPWMTRFFHLALRKSYDCCPMK